MIIAISAVLLLPPSDPHKAPSFFFFPFLPSSFPFPLQFYYSHKIARFVFPAAGQLEINLFPPFSVQLCLPLSLFLSISLVSCPFSPGQCVFAQCNLSWQFIRSQSCYFCLVLCHSPPFLIYIQLIVHSCQFTDRSEFCVVFL